MELEGNDVPVSDSPVLSNQIDLQQPPGHAELAALQPPDSDNVPVPEAPELGHEIDLPRPSGHAELQATSPPDVADATLTTVPPSSSSPAPSTPADGPIDASLEAFLLPPAASAAAADQVDRPKPSPPRPSSPASGRYCPCKSSGSLAIASVG